MVILIMTQVADYRIRCTSTKPWPICIPDQNRLILAPNIRNLIFIQRGDTIDVNDIKWNNTFVVNGGTNGVFVNLPTTGIKEGQVLIVSNLDPGQSTTPIDAGTNIFVDKIGSAGTIQGPVYLRTFKAVATLTPWHEIDGTIPPPLLTEPVKWIIVSDQ